MTLPRSKSANVIDASGSHMLSVVSQVQPQMSQSRLKALQTNIKRETLGENTPAMSLCIEGNG